MRVAIIGLVPAPYREPLYYALSQSEGITLRAFYLQSKDSLRHWSRGSGGYEAVTVTTLTPECLYSAPLIGVMNLGLIRSLRRFSPDCLLIHGYSYLSQMQVMRWAIRRRTPYLLWADSNDHSLGATGPLAKLKQLCLNYFCRSAAGVLTIGSANENFWRHYGVEPDRQFRSPLAVDNDHFAEQAAHWRRQKVAQRQALGLPAGRLLVFAGRFVPAKNLETLLRALAQCPRSGNTGLSLLLVGDGPEKPRLNRLIRQLRLDGVFQVPFQSHTDMPKFYAISDALVLPSAAEPWGLVVNEAMACSLPVLLSRHTGCRPDLLEEGANGFSFDESSVEAVARCLRRFAATPEDEMLRMGSRSLQLISRWNYGAAVSGTLAALEAAVRGGRAACSAR